MLAAVDAPCCCCCIGAQVACMDYGFHMAVTSWSAKVAADMATLVKQGINSFKFFMAYKVRTLAASCVAGGGLATVGCCNGTLCIKLLWCADSALTSHQLGGIVCRAPAR